MRNLVDMTTGEWIEKLPEKGRLLPNMKRLREIGTILPFPYQCRNPEDLDTVLKIIDPYYKKPTSRHVGFPSIAQSVIDGTLTPIEAKVLQGLCTTVSGWNIWFGDKSNIQAGVSKASFHRAIKRLTLSGYIRPHIQSKAYDTFLLHPSLAWKGCLQHRDNLLKAWYNKKSQS